MEEKYVLWLFNYPIRLCVCLLGIIGNIISIIIWNRLKRRVGHICTAVMFIMLSAMDLGVLILSCFVDVLPAAYPTIKKSTSYILFYSYVGHPLHFFFLFASIFTLVVMSVSRARFIICPFASLVPGRILQNKLLIIVFTLAGICNLPSFFEYRKLCDANSTCTLYKLSYEKNFKLQRIVFVSHCTLGLFLPWFITISANVLLIFKTKRLYNPAEKQVRRPTTNIHRHITITIIVTSLVSMLLLTLQCVSRCIIMFITESEPNYRKYRFIAALGDFAIPLFSASNFICFHLSGKAFRKELRILFSSRRVAPSSS